MKKQYVLSSRSVDGSCVGEESVPEQKNKTNVNLPQLVKPKYPIQPQKLIQKTREKSEKHSRKKRSENELLRKNENFDTFLRKKSYEKNSKFFEKIDEFQNLDESLHQRVWLVEFSLFEKEFGKFLWHMMKQSYFGLFRFSKIWRKSTFFEFWSIISYMKKWPIGRKVWKWKSQKMKSGQ